MSASSGMTGLFQMELDLQIHLRSVSLGKTSLSDRRRARRPRLIFRSVKALVFSQRVLINTTYYRPFPLRFVGG